MIQTNQVLKAKRSNKLAKVKFVDAFKNLVQIEYINPSLSNFFGIFTLTFEEVDQHWDIMKDHPASKINQPSKVISLVDDCDHKWVKYNGFTNHFEYCSKCDKKKTL